MKSLAVLSLLFFAYHHSAEASCTLNKTGNEVIKAQTKFGQLQIHYNNNDINYVFPLEINNIGIGAYCKKLTLIPESNLLLVEFFNGGVGTKILSDSTSLIIISYSSQRMDKMHEFLLKETITNSTSMKILYQWLYEFNSKTRTLRLFDPKSKEQKLIQIEGSIRAR